MRGYWSRIDPEGNGEIGMVIDKPVRASLGWSIYKTGISINVGQYFSVYRDLSTKFQQRSQGYWDFWGLNSPPDLSAKIELTPKQDWEAYYKIERD